eukprot:5013887-Alexandrium_andersonii.AAC.1
MVTRIQGSESSRWKRRPFELTKHLIRVEESVLTCILDRHEGWAQPGSDGLTPRAAAACDRA